MKRRDFLKKAGLAIAAAPILVQANVAKPDENSPERIGWTTFDSGDQKVVPDKRSPHMVFTDVAAQTKFLQTYFAKHAKWQVFSQNNTFKDSKGWDIGYGGKVIVSTCGNHTSINFRGWNMYVEPGSMIRALSKEIRIFHYSPSGNELDWRWRPG